MSLFFLTVLSLLPARVPARPRLISPQNQPINSIWNLNVNPSTASIPLSTHTAMPPLPCEAQQPSSVQVQLEIPKRGWGAKIPGRSLQQAVIVGRPQQKPHLDPSHHQQKVAFAYKLWKSCSSFTSSCSPHSQQE